MIVFKKTEDLQQYLQRWPGTKQPSIGFIPTMGALHEGHASLVKTARQNNEIVICSIFVNPTQFNDTADYEKYPVTLEEDIAMLTALSCDIVFIPSVIEMYPDGLEHTQDFNFGTLEQVWEGAHRPGHFRGVGQIVSRLLRIIQPDTLYLGQKDYQQCLIIQKLLQQVPIDKIPELVIVPTVREEDGLAKSSRNLRLTLPQRNIAGVIYQCLVSIQAKKNISSWKIVQHECIHLLKDKGFEPEYVGLAQAETLDSLTEFDDQQPMIAIIAAKLGEIRLIDNILL